MKLCTLGPIVALTFLAGVLALNQALAQTIEYALAQAYRNNETLNAERAGVRGTDEEVPQALAGYRPKIGATADIGRRFMKEKGAAGDQQQMTTTPRGVGLIASQTVFDGLQTPNRVSAAESRVRAARETLRVMEQTVLLDAATAYMDVMRDIAAVELQTRNVELLREEVEQARNRLQTGTLTTTDLAQTQSRLAATRSDLLAAQAALESSRATYERVIGSSPGKLSSATPVDRFLPTSRDNAIAIGQSQNPTVIAAMHGTDIAVLQARIAEGALYPTVMVEGSLRRRYDNAPEMDVSFPAKTTEASIVGRVVVPIYQGGMEYAVIRQSKEMIGQKRLSLEAVRKLVRASVIQAWASLNAARAQIESARSQVDAAETAFDGVRREYQIGQRSTLELLIAQQDLLNARVGLITAQRNRVVTSYVLLAAIGQLSPQILGLPGYIYDPIVHYQQVRDSWIGIRTPDGR
jgi:outer membrane protein